MGKENQMQTAGGQHKPEDSITRKTPEITVQWNHELNGRDNLSSPMK